MEDFNSKYTGAEVEEMLDQIANGEIGGGITAETDPIFSASPAASITDAKKAEWDGKQDAIADLATIREGASKGATALQSVPSEYGTKAWVTEQARDIANDAVGDFEAVAVEPLAEDVSQLKEAIGNKVDKVTGKGLSAEDFTSALKIKLEGLNNYDDTEISATVASLQTQLDTLVSGDTTTAIETFNEVIAFLEGIADTEDLAGIIGSIEQQLMWTKAEGEAGVRLKGTNGTATGNFAISAGDDKKASDGTQFTSAASGDHAVVFGYGNTCAGRSTLAQGLYNTVNGKDSVAFGQRNLVDGDQAFAAGQLNEVTTRLGVAIGYKNKATNTDSIAIGYQNTSGGSGSVAMGDTCEANGTSSTAMGYKTKAAGAYSSTFGENTQATNNGEVAMGSYNNSTTSTDTAEQTAFSFGIGTSDTNRFNALEIKKNGDVYIGDTLLNEKIPVWDDKQDAISDLDDIRSGAEKGSTAVQPSNLASVATSGSYNDLSDKPSIPAEQVNADWNATSGKAQILNKPTIPSAVTESTVSGWGFTKNTGTYSKPSGGIPETDLASAVQTSLGKADTALQSYTEKYTGTVTAVKINNTTKNPTNGVVDLGTVITAHQDISGKQDVISDLETIHSNSQWTDNLKLAIQPYEFESAKTIEIPSGLILDSDTAYALPTSGYIDVADDVLLTRRRVKTINGESIYGSGDITISGGGVSEEYVNNAIANAITKTLNTPI